MSIDLINLTFSYPNKKGREQPLFKSLNLSIPEGSIAGIVGLSGSGKSTLLMLVAGLLRPKSGLIQIDYNLPEVCRLKGMFGLVFQSPDLLPWRTIGKNIQLSRKIHGMKFDRKVIIDLLKEVELETWIDKYPHELSGGMQQRVSIARAIAVNPRFLLLDEPFSHLDELLRFELLLYIQSYALANSTTVLFITHDISEAVIASDVIYVLPSKIGGQVDKIEVNLAKPRSIETSNSRKFHDIVSEVRRSLQSQKL